MWWSDVVVGGYGGYDFIGLVFGDDVSGFVDEIGDDFMVGGDDVGGGVGGWCEARTTAVPGRDVAASSPAPSPARRGAAGALVATTRHERVP